MKKSFAQQGQDLIADYYFRHYPARNKIFLDVGAFDGINFSNTRLFYEQGWSGICIEPVTKNYQKLKRLYQDTRVITVRAAATDYEGTMELNVATIPWAIDWGSDVSSPSDDTVKRWNEYQWEKETVPATTVNKILESLNVKHVDLVSIDVEGQEMEVLLGFDTNKYNPHIIIIEYSNPVEKKTLTDCLINRGYYSWIDNGQDIFFVQGTKLHNIKILSLDLWLKYHPRRILYFFVEAIKRIIQ